MIASDSRVEPREEPRPLTVTIAYAYSPRENTGSRGGYHVQVHERLVLGRIKREPGDALCKGQRRFWGLQSGRSANDFKQWGCEGCHAVARRLKRPMTVQLPNGRTEPLTEAVRA